MPLKVAFYSDAFASSGYGLGRYARELFAALEQVAHEIELRPVSAHVGAGNAAEHELIRAGQTNVLNCLSKRGSVLPYRRSIMAALWSSTGLPRLEHWTPWADLVHCVELDYRVATHKPLVVTIHDIGPLTHPHFFRKSHPWLLRTALKSAVNRAAAVICVSRTT